MRDVIAPATGGGRRRLAHAGGATGPGGGRVRRHLAPPGADGPPGTRGRRLGQPRGGCSSASLRPMALSSSPSRDRVAVGHVSRESIRPTPSVLSTSSPPAVSGAPRRPGRSSTSPTSASPAGGSKRPYDSAVRDGLTAPVVLERRLAQLRGSGRWGVRRLDRLLIDSGGESVLERRFLRLLRDAGLPRPETQVVQRRGGRHVGRVDFLFRDHSSWSRSAAEWVTRRRPIGAATRSGATSSRTSDSPCTSTPGRT